MRSSLRYSRILLLVLLALALMLPGTAVAQSQDPGPQDERPTVKPRMGEEAMPGELIVKFKKDVGPSAQAALRNQEGLEKKKEFGLIDAELVKVRGRSAEAAIRNLNARSDVEYAEPNYIVYPTGYSDEPRFSELWGLHNTGQTVVGSPGTANVDINGKEASTVTQGSSSLKVAVIDDGVDFSHPDLSARAWKNPGESGSGKETNGKDDDGNGLVDDVNGWDYCGDDNTVHDSEDSHGTHVAGTIAASVNNQGVVGVAPNVKIMALKFLCANGGATSDAILAIQYAKSKGAKLSNNSWGGGGYSQALKDTIEASGQLFVASAGNGGSDGVGDDNDVTPHYPDGYNSPNILSVAAANNKGSFGSFSNYGKTSVDISAPGVSILSAVPGTPSNPAAALSSVGTAGGKAVTAGFGADEIGDATKRASFFSKAFTAVNRGTQQVVLVDDDRSNTGFYPDVRIPLSAASQSATGTAPQVIEVGSDSNGPSLSQLSGKTVVWATGQAWWSGTAGTTLTSTDQSTLTNFLNGGGKLVITGMDALYDIETSSFVTSTLKLNVVGDVGGATFKGTSGTAFAGESYTFNSGTAVEMWHDKVTPAGASAATQGVYPGTPGGWESWNGTSMAAPHATGVAALVASVNSGLLSKPVDLKKVLMDTGKPLSATAGKTVTGDMVNAKAAVDAAKSDAVAPKGTVKINGGAAYTKSPSVKLYLSATDPSPASGVSSMRLKNDGGSWSGWTSYATSKSWTLKKANGTRAVYVQYRDRAGNLSTAAVDTIKLDMVKPTISGMSPRHTSIIRDTTPTIKATVRDNMANLRKANIKLYVNGKLISATKYSYSAATDVLTYNSPRLSKGKKTVRIVATDAAKNVGAKSWYFTIK